MCAGLAIKEVVGGVVHMPVWTGLGSLFVVQVGFLYCYDAVFLRVGLLEDAVGNVEGFPCVLLPYSQFSGCFGWTLTHWDMD